MKGLIVEIYRPANFPDCTNGGISAKVSRAVLTGCGLPEIFEPSPDMPELRLIKRLFSGKPYYHCEPVDGLRLYSVGWMAGGNFAYTCDSRFSAICQYPVSIHDRQESESEYKTLST